MSRLPASAGSRARVRATVLTAASCATALLLGGTAYADTNLGPGGFDEPAPAEAGTFDAVRLSANLPAPVLNVNARTSAEPGEITPVTVTVEGPDATDEIVVLQQYGAGGWVAISSTAIDDHARAYLTVAQSAEGLYRYRLRISPTTRHKAATQDFVVQVSRDLPTGGEPTDAPTEQPPATPEPAVLCGGEVKLRFDGSSWVCTYDDEFDGDSLDRRYWVPQVSASSGFYSGTATAPACVIDDPRTIGVRDGSLLLSAIVLDQAVPCGKKASPMASGSVSHHGTFSQTYGRFEVRAKVPSYAGKGLQETFWLWPNDPLKYGHPHPASGEIDFGEFYSNHADLNIPVMHYLFDPATISYKTSTNLYTAHHCTIRVGEFNTYTLEWAPGKMAIFINDQLCVFNKYVATNAPATNPRAPFDVPFFLTLSQLFGTTGNEFDLATGPRDAQTVVDYVRIWA